MLRGRPLSQKAPLDREICLEVVVKWSHVHQFRFALTNTGRNGQELALKVSVHAKSTF